MKNIKVVDDTFLEAAKSFKETSDDLDLMLQAIGKQINKASTEGFSEGNVSINLQRLYKYISELQNELSEIGTDVQSFMQNYLNALDEADEYIY